MSVELPEDSATAVDADSESGTRWEGYSDYEIVSRQVATSVDRAIEAFSRIEAAHIEDAAIDKSTAAEARGRIRAATMKLIPEMEADREDVEQYDTILSRWEGEDGLLVAFREASLRRECPGELYQLVLDIKTAGWELGYLKAGRTASTEPEDTVEAEVESIFGNS